MPRRAACPSARLPVWPKLASRRSPSTVLELNLGDVVRLRKVHPCGGFDWQVTRLGADIGLRCLTCGRRIMLDRPILEKRLKEFVSRSRPETSAEKGTRP